MLDIIYKFNNFISNDYLFWSCALLGSGLFIIQFLLNFLGSDGQDEFGLVQFKWLSKQALTGFLVMFGWIGLTCRKEFDLSGLSSIAIALLGGIVAFLMIGLIFKGALKLRSSGTVFRIEDIIGKEATIYQRIPKNGIGKISVMHDNFTYEVDAKANEDLASFTLVHIIKKENANTVLVVPIK